MSRNLKWVASFGAKDLIFYSGEVGGATGFLILDRKEEKSFSFFNGEKSQSLETRSSRVVLKIDERERGREGRGKRFVRQRDGIYRTEKW